ncbi:MAG: general secretion pathway protein C [Halieaceae bacterium]
MKLAFAAALALWLVSNLATLIWRLYPATDAEIHAGVVPINDIGGAAGGVERAPIDLQEMLSWQLFGRALEQALQAPVVISNEQTDIERNAKETRLKLLLRGVVASDEGKAGRAMIESEGRQELYSLNDKLPVTGRVIVARILPDRVILDNAGKYELLHLFEDKSSSVGALQVPVAEKVIKNDPKVAEMANNYRQRLYDNPQSLADVVKISAVRKGGKMQGYRVSAGRDKDQFAALGFQANDVVTSVNGIELNDPAKAMELYRLMRSASEASFTVQRGEEEQTLVVNLGDVAP